MLAVAICWLLGSCTFSLLSSPMFNVVMTTQPASRTVVVHSGDETGSWLCLQLIGSSHDWVWLWLPATPQSVELWQEAVGDPDQWPRVSVDLSFQTVDVQGKHKVEYAGCMPTQQAGLPSEGRRVEWPNARVSQYEPASTMRMGILLLGALAIDVGLVMLL